MEEETLLSKRDPSPLAGLPKIERTSIADTAYEAIRDSIIAGRFPPGMQLVESAVADELSVSRGPVREALHRLRVEGLVVEGRQRGLYIRDFTLEDLVDVYNVRIGLETMAIRLMHRMRTPTAPLRGHIAEMADAAAAGDMEQLNERELAFHRTLCDLSDNRHIAGLFHAISAQVQLAVAFDNALAIERLPRYSDPLIVAQEHEPVVEAIEHGDEDHAALVLVEHIVGSVESIFDALPQAVPQSVRDRLLRPGGTTGPVHHDQDEQ